MAPKRKRSSEVSPNRDLVIKPIGRPEANRRITRSLTIREGGVSSSSPSSATRRSSSATRRSSAASKKKGKKPIKQQQPPPKKPRKTPKKTDVKDEESDDNDDAKAKSVSVENTSESDDDDDDKKSDSSAAAAAAAAAASDKGKKVAETGGDSSSQTTIIIEHCKKCKSFKDRADEARAGLETSIPGINVVINPDKPREGCFEIRAEDGKAFVSLLDMKRPYKPMRDLDMDEVVADIVKEIGE